MPSVANDPIAPRNHEVVSWNFHNLLFVDNVLLPK